MPLFFPIMRSLKYHDYKKNDKALIHNIPFILTYTEDVTMIVPMDYRVLAAKWEDAQPTNLFSYVAAATVVNPKELFLPYIVPAKEEDESVRLISEKKKAIESYISRKLQTKVRFVPRKDKSNLRKILDIEENVKLSGWLLVENNELDVVAIDDMDQIAECSDTYRFDMVKVAFKTTGKSDWLNNINRNVGITVRDLAIFLNRSPTIGEQPFFLREDNKTLYDIYELDRVAWKKVCGLLKKKKNKNSDIARFRNPNDNAHKKTEEHIYFMPATCFQSVSQIIKKLKDKKIIKNKSDINWYSTDSCKVVIYENNGCEMELQKLFVQQHLLMASHDYDLRNENGDYVLCFDALTVEDIEYAPDWNDRDKKKVFMLLEKLQKAGFIQLNVKEESFDIIYGSRQIKELFMEEGKFLEVYTYYKVKKCNAFDDVITGSKFCRDRDTTEENEMDCFATKGFQTVIVECKAKEFNGREDELEKAKKDLHCKVKKYAINGSGLLVIDCQHGIPETENENPDGVTVCSVRNIEEIICRQIKK